LAAALNFDIVIATPIPADFGLPPIADNIIESVVVRPAEALVVEGLKDPIGPILKRKNKRFKEEVAYHQAQKWSYQLHSDQDEVIYLLELANYLNENRIRSAIFKLDWPKSPQAISQLRELVWNDILASYQVSLDSDLPTMPALVQKQFYAEINELIGAGL